MSVGGLKRAEIIAQKNRGQSGRVCAQPGCFSGTYDGIQFLCEIKPDAFHAEVPRRERELFLLQRVLLQDLIDHVENGAVLGLFADAFDVFDFHHGEVVAEGLVDVGDDGGDFLIL